MRKSMYMDYDYPNAYAKPVNPISANVTINSAPSNTLYNRSKISTSNQFRSNNLSDIIPAQSNFNSLQSNYDKTKFLTLDTVVPAPSSNKSTLSNGYYYDIPKNVPVDPRFVKPPNPPSTTPKFPVKDNLLPISQELPKKSPTVRNKILTYANPSTAPTEKFSHFDRVYRETEKLASLTKVDTSKSLPPLPTRNSGNTGTTVAINLYDKPTVRTNVSNNGTAVKTTLQFIDLNVEDDDDDDDDGDYDYDYVCLESKKKLDDEDAAVKKDIAKEWQSRYEQLVFNSSSSLNLQRFENSLQNACNSNNNNKINPVHKKQFLPTYSHYLSIARRNFENWTKLSLEIIKHRHASNVYINFTKHILLSGQNLLLVIKSLNRHFGEIENLNHNADLFCSFLKQIVIKTKKVAHERQVKADLSDPKVTDEMIDAIKGAILFTANFDVNLYKYI